MSQRFGVLGWGALAALALVGCDDGPRSEVDAGCPDGAICVEDSGVTLADAGMADAGPPPDPCDFTVAGRAPGSACSRGNLCSGDLECQEEQPGNLSTLNEDGSDGPTVPVSFNPSGGMCSELCPVDGDPATGEDTCGDCATCGLGTVIGGVRFIQDVDEAGNAFGLCRPRCTPEAGANGGCREGYTCDLLSGTCVDACSNDDWCKIRDFDDIGGPDDANDFIVNADLNLTCNAATGRCDSMGMAGAQASDACETLNDCADNQACIGDPGFCTSFGCGFEGFECATGENCSGRVGADWGACLAACVPGGAGAVVSGPEGHGDGCRAGFQCSWDGLSERDAPAGGCIPGEYNDAPVENTVGSPCQTVADCHSPYGKATCFFSTENNVDSGICMLNDCAVWETGEAPNPVVEHHGILPGVEVDGFCDTASGDHQCILTSSEDAQTLCVDLCESASECPAGYACTNLGSDASPLQICWARCDTDANCREGATCETPAGSACTADSEECFCSDRTPRMEEMPDAGMPDAGVAPAT